MIYLKRVYDSPKATDGLRILVDRLWPRGLTKEKARVDLWLKEVAPSTELRKWYDHDPAKYELFKKRYEAELQQNRALETLQSVLQNHPVVTLLYASKSPFNDAKVLYQFLHRESGA